MLVVVLIKIYYFYSNFRIPNGKYIDEPKYMHAVSTLDEPKYTSCHLEDPSIKQHFSSNLTTGGSHPDDGDISMTVIKSEDGGVSHSYVLPPFLH